jgi:sulfide:quinone oxidoreductase
VAIIGGGSAGASVASQLMNRLPKNQHAEIAVIEPSDTHWYMPYWTMVGGLGLKVQNSKRPMQDVMPCGVSWVKERCEGFEPEQKALRLSNGRRLEYDVLVVAAGLQQNFDAIPGLQETVGKNGVASIYSSTYSPKVWENIQATKSGTAIFTNPNTPVNCGGAPQKIAYLAECAWKQAGVRGAIDIHFCTPGPGIFACPTYRTPLEMHMKDCGIQPHTRTNLVAVDGERKIATFRNMDTEEEFTKHFDFLHVTPPMSGPTFIRNSPLANEAGFVDVDPGTCQHTKYPEIFSLGDASSLPTSKTYSAVSSQAPVVVQNLMQQLEAGRISKPAVYDGYTACPVLLGNGKLMLAEFNGYTNEAAPTFDLIFNQQKGNWFFYFMKRHVFERVYWHLMPIGRWFGKNLIFRPRLA